MLYRDTGNERSVCLYSKKSAVCALIQPNRFNAQLTVHGKLAFVR